MSTSMQREPERMGIEHVPMLLLLNEAGLDKVIKSELEAKNKETGFVQRYAELKRAALSAPLGGVAKLLRKWDSDGVDNLCLRIRYCERKTWFADRLKLIEKFSEERMYSGSKAIDVINGIEGGPEMLSIAREFAKNYVDAAVTYSIPTSLIIKIFKYGLDELCPCN